MLGINEATLRQWADQGLVHAFRTPGGHRRFSAEDIHALIETGVETTPPIRLGGAVHVLPGVRRRLRGSARNRPPAWMAVFDEEGHQRMRALGREFLELCLGSMDQPDKGEAASAASKLGSVYGEELAGRGIFLNDALQAFLFFRNATLAGIKPALLKWATQPEDVWSALERLTRLTDKVLLSMTRYYGQVPGVGTGDGRASQPSDSLYSQHQREG